ncbi:hypothetical protein [Actinoplanes sp. NPDC026623]|uniref:hypothetical protein n=1 Tax=Actinoplanes sp. NPDC026623 TaxID=3155610 RepID=UPI0033FB2F0F
MTAGEFCATDVHRLPRSLVRVVRAPAEDPRLLMWVGRPGVRLLSFDEHRQVDRASLQRFPQERDASVAWASVPRDLVIRTERCGGRAIEDYLRDDGDVIITWGSLSLPSVLLSASETSDRVEAILATAALLWLYRPDQRLVLERNHVEDTVTIARIPGAAPPPISG